MCQSHSGNRAQYAAIQRRWQNSTRKRRAILLYLDDWVPGLMWLIWNHTTSKHYCESGKLIKTYDCHRFGSLHPGGANAPIRKPEIIPPNIEQNSIRQQP